MRGHAHLPAHVEHGVALRSWEVRHLVIGADRNDAGKKLLENRGITLFGQLDRAAFGQCRTASSLRSKAVPTSKGSLSVEGE